jgi:NAD-dependent DNA ligase
MFKANVLNNAGKAIDQLSGICTGILADGIVTDTEAQFFRDWVTAHAPHEPTWPFTDILARLDRIFADGQVDEAERVELKAMMEAICGFVNSEQPETETHSTALPLDVPQPKTVIFEDRMFAITGRFAYGTRAKVIDAIESRHGRASDGPPTRESNYLVIGTFASRDWLHANYGRKIERAVELRESGSGIAILGEDHWRKFVSF